MPAAGKTGDRITFLKGPGLAIALFATICLVGTIGYVVIEGWSAWDAFYMTMVSVTTVGYREIHPMSRLGELWTVIVLLGGVATLFYTASTLMQIVVEGGLYAHYTARRFNRMLEQLSNHFIICGYGRIGSTIASEFQKQGVPYVIVDRDGHLVHSVIEGGGVAVEADASREDVLIKVGIHRARGLISAVSTDADNMYIVLSARVLRPDLFIIARVESEDAEPKLRRAGADRVISPYQLGAVQIAATALRPAVVDFMRLATSSERLDLAAEQIDIGEGAPFAGKKLKDTNLRQDFGVVVVAIKRASGHMQFNPSPDDSLHVGDQLVVLGNVDQLKALEAVARGADSGAARRVGLQPRT